MRRLTAALLLLTALATRAGAEDASPSLREGEGRSLPLSAATRAATAIVEVPSGVEALHVFVSVGAVGASAVKAGPVDGAGAFLDSVVDQAFDGRAHVVRPAPSPGLHRIVVTTRTMANTAHLDVEFDRKGAAPIVDLERERLSGAGRRFRVYVPPHEGTAELRDRGAADGVRVLLRSADGVLGAPAPLPLALVGTEPGGLVGLDVLRGEPDAIAHVRLVVPPVGTLSGATADETRPLEIGAPLRFTLGGAASDAATFELLVREAGPGLRLAVTATSPGDAKETPDPDVYVRRGKPVDSPMEDADFAGVGRGPHESIRLGGTEGLAPGPYFVRVELPSAEAPVDLTLVAEPIVKAGPPCPVATPLPLDTWVAGDLHAFADPSLVRWYEVAVPEGAQSVHAQVVDATSDVDLVAVDPRTGAIVGRSLGFRIDEALVLRLPPSAVAPPKAPASYLIGVLSRNGAEDEIAFRLAVAADRAPELPTDLRLPPFLRSRASSPTEALAAAVCEIQVADGTGSAVCISSEGYLLTCRHVVVDDETERPTTGEILVAFPDDFRRAPRQAFRGRVVASDEGLDLALLKLVSDVYDRPLAKGLALPVIGIGDADALRLGDSILVVGYPGDGTERSRPPVTVSRGIVAGLESDASRLLWIKTDAWIATGHSGGAVVDADGHLVGLAAAVLGERAALGLARPTSRIPPAWLREAGVAAPPVK